MKPAMKTLHLLDPELRLLAEQYANVKLTHEALPNIRKLTSAARVPGDPGEFGVRRREEVFARAKDGQSVRCLIYEPIHKTGPLPALLHMHGGGYVMGRPEMADRRNTRVAASGVIVVSVDYRLAPEHPYPAALEDCFACLNALTQKSPVLGVDPSRIAVGGESAGGGLAVALAIKARDEGDRGIVFQHLVYPMLDNETGTPGKPLDPLLGEFVWTPAHNRFGWSAYLDGADPAEAVPAQTESLQGLPPARISLGGLDLFLEENITYARRLMGAQVSTELQIYPSACHGFPQARQASVAQRFEADYLSGLLRGLQVTRER